jgi:hypothetical protein
LKNSLPKRKVLKLVHKDPNIVDILLNRVNRKLFFSSKHTSTFLKKNHLDYIIRSNGFQENGYFSQHFGKCISIYSAPHINVTVTSTKVMDRINSRFGVEINQNANSKGLVRDKNEKNNWKEGSEDAIDEDDDEVDIMKEGSDVVTSTATSVEADGDKAATSGSDEGHGVIIQFANPKQMKYKLLPFFTTNESIDI